MPWRRLIKAVFLLGLVMAVFLFWFTSPQKPMSLVLPLFVPNISNGKNLYAIGGCASCHVPQGLPTPIGLLYPPNISGAETGIGRWSESDFLIAMTKGISPEGKAYIPAFPYLSYRNMNDADLLDLFAYLKTLPSEANEAPDHDVVGLALVRRGLVLWQKMVYDAEPALTEGKYDDGYARGAYLVNGPGHCGECHTPRNFFMMSDLSRNLAGGPHPEGIGNVPSLRGLIARGRYKNVAELAEALQHGEAFGYDKLSSGGMGKVQENIAKLPEEDILAIATYLSNLKVLP